MRTLAGVPVLLTLLAAMFIACADVALHEGGETPERPALEGGGIVRPGLSPDDEDPYVDPNVYPWLFPDLQTLPIREMYIGTDGASRTLRFSTTVANAGEGPLELEGTVAGNTVTATQRVYASDGTVGERVAGTFVFHSQHTHWHFVDFTVFEIWTVREDGELGDLVATTGKATFCAVDEIRMDSPEGERASEPAYLACDEDVQGISAGWTDTYGAEISGQELDISALPDGKYAVRSTVDPAGRLQESDETNNSVVEYVQITGTQIEFRESS